MKTAELSKKQRVKEDESLHFHLDCSVDQGCAASLDVWYDAEHKVLFHHAKDLEKLRVFYPHVKVKDMGDKIEIKIQVQKSDMV